MRMEWGWLKAGRAAREVSAEATAVAASKWLAEQATREINVSERGRLCNLSILTEYSVRYTEKGPLIRLS
jgi:hypothetical protein